MVNDLVDVDTDRINHPERVLVRGVLSRKYAISLACLLNVMAILVAYSVNLEVFLIALSAIGFLVAVFAFYVAKMLIDRNPQAWTWAVMVNIIGIVLYLFSIFAVEGIVLCVLTLIYLNIPVVKEHFN